MGRSSKLELLYFTLTDEARAKDCTASVCEKETVQNGRIYLPTDTYTRSIMASCSPTDNECRELCICVRPKKLVRTADSVGQKGQESSSMNVITSN